MARTLRSRAAGRGFQKSAFFAFGGNALYALSQAAMLVVLAKVGTTAMVGQFGLGLAIVTPIMLFSKLQLRSVIATDVGDEFSFVHYLYLRLSATAMACGVALCLLAWLNYGRQTSAVVLAVAAVKSVEATSDLLYGLLQKHDQWGRIMTALAAKAAGAPAALWAGLWLAESPALGLLGVAGWYLVVLAVVEAPWARRLLAGETAASPPALSASAIKRLLNLTLPLGVVASLVSLNVNLPRYAVGAYLGMEALGYYTALTHLLLAGNMVVQGLGQAALSRLAGYRSGDRESFWRLLRYLLSRALLLGVFGVIVALLMGETILAVVYPADYAAYAEVLVWLTIGTALTFLSSVLGYAMTAARLFRAQLPLYSLSSVVCLLSSLSFVPAYGLLGAAYATILGWSVAAAGSAALLVCSKGDTVSARAAKA